jgi:ABC-2 type transport system permease protein
MNKILKIAQREYVETTKTKTFIIGLVMVPLIIGGIIFFTKRVSHGTTASRPPVRIAVTDLSKEVFTEAKNAFDNYNKSNPNRQILLREIQPAADPNAAQDKARDELRRGRLDAYAVLDGGILNNDGGIHLYTHKPKPGSVDMLWTVESLLRKAVENQRCKLADISPDLLDQLRRVPLERVEIGSAAEQDRVRSTSDRAAEMMVPFFFMFMVYMGMVGTGQHMISSVIEEKGSRVMEVLLSAVSPFQLMAGKIVGLAGVGLTIVGLWGGAAYLAARWQGLSIQTTNQLLLYLVVYYILGFLLLSAVFAGVGSICNTIKETQGLMMPIMLVFILPLIAWYRLVQNPGGALARALSFVPPLTPMVMVLRLSTGTEIWIGEILASIIVLTAAVLFTMWAAARIFRTGILMYGKRPSLREVLRWLKYR